MPINDLQPAQTFGKNKLRRLFNMVLCVLRWFFTTKIPNNTFKYTSFTSKQLLHNVLILISHQTKMDYKKTIIYILLLFAVCSNAVFGQKKADTFVTKSYFKNGLIAREFYIGADQMVDTMKTYHIEGGIDEKFYFTGNNVLDGVCEKFSSEGKLVTTWVYKKGILVRRTDHSKEFNLKNKETFDYNFNTIIKANLELKSDPNNLQLIYNRAISRMYLNDNILAELDLLAFKTHLENIKANFQGKANENLLELNKNLAEIYSRLSTLYSRFENDNLSIQYKLKALETEPTETRHLYNLGSYLATEAQDYRLAISYLDEVIRRVPNHNFANWVLGYTYLELEDYQKAVNCINIAFENEDNLYVYGYGNEESDLRTIRGLAYHKLGKTDLGIKDLNEALRINDKNSTANKYLGIVYDDLGESQKACDYFQKSRALGFEKKYYNKSLEAYIKKACKENASKIVNSKTVVSLSPKDLPYIAPNPAENAVEVFNYPYTNFNFDINDVSGKRIGHGKSNNKTIQVSGIPSGLYILTVEKEGKQEIFKLIKK
jgi:tetratricopeptide (TPR) repeat protein